MMADNEKGVIARCLGTFQLALATSILQKGSSRAIFASKDLSRPGSPVMEALEVCGIMHIDMMHFQDGHTTRTHRQR
jgi:hypothetical protein